MNELTLYRTLDSEIEAIGDNHELQLSIIVTATNGVLQKPPVMGKQHIESTNLEREEKTCSN